MILDGEHVFASDEDVFTVDEDVFTAEDPVFLAEDPVFAVGDPVIIDDLARSVLVQGISGGDPGGNATHKDKKASAAGR